MSLLFSQIGANAAVATDVEECSQIGIDMLMHGGNAMDATVAAMFCVGIVNAESSGLGGYVLLMNCLLSLNFFVNYLLVHGGNAMGATVASMFCVGGVNAESSGLEGYVLLMNCFLALN